MAAVTMRARPVDNSKPLLVVCAADVADIHEATSVQRNLPQIATGMEKEEEEEHHIRLVINQQHAQGSVEPIKHFIPTPKADIEVPYYEDIYRSRQQWHQPQHYIRIQDRYLETDMVDYDLDTDDEEWLERYNNESNAEVHHLDTDKFEQLMDRLERATPDQNLISYDEARNLLEMDDHIVKAVYGFWKDKRRRRLGVPLRPSVKSDRGRDPMSATDAYVAFRRRAEQLKVQTRKNRQRDESGYEKMLKLRRDFERALTLLEMIKRRERTKRELLIMSKEIFEKRYELDDWDERYFIVEEEVVEQPPQPEATTLQAQKPGKKRPMKGMNGEKRDKHGKIRVGHYTQAHEDAGGDMSQDDDRPLRTSLTIKIPKPAENPFHFKKKKGIQYCVGHGTGLPPLVKDYGMRFAFIPMPGHTDVRCGRRRIGRGGRALVDRTPRPLQDKFEADPNHVDYFQFAGARRQHEMSILASIPPPSAALASQDRPIAMAIDQNDANVGQASANVTANALQSFPSNTSTTTTTTSSTILADGAVGSSTTATITTATASSPSLSVAKALSITSGGADAQGNAEFTSSTRQDINGAAASDTTSIIAASAGAGDDMAS